MRIGKPIHYVLLAGVLMIHKPYSLLDDTYRIREMNLSRGPSVPNLIKDNRDIQLAFGLLNKFPSLPASQYHLICLLEKNPRHLFDQKAKDRPKSL